MTAHAGRNRAVQVALRHKRVPVIKHCCTGIRWRLLGKRRPLIGEICRELPQIVVRQEREEIVHWRIFPPARFERFQLVVEISGGLARKPWEIRIVRALSLLPVTGCAGLDTVGHVGRIGLLRRRHCAEEA